MTNTPKTDDRPLTKRVFNPETGKFTTEQVTESQLQRDLTDELELASLRLMSPDALIALVVRCNGWQMALKNREEIAEAFNLKLAMAGWSEKDIHKALPVMREWYDREIGKSVQRIDQRVQSVPNAAMGDMTNEQLLIEIRNLAASGKLPSNVKLLSNGTLDIIDLKEEEIK